MLYRHQPDPLQLRLRCRNPRCGAKLKLPAMNPRDAFCAKGCERQFYARHCRACEDLFSPKTSRRVVCSKAACRYRFKTNPEQFYGLRYPYSAMAHNASRNPIKPGIKTGIKSGRGLRIIAGPEVPEINLRTLSVPAPKANRAWQKAERRTTRKVLIQYTTPPVNIIGGYRFPGSPAIDLRPSRAAPATPAIPIGDESGIPNFLMRTHAAEAVLP